MAVEVGVATLKALGLDKAADKLDKMQKMNIAYNNFEFIRQENVDKFNQKLEKETLDKKTGMYNQVVFTDLKEYGQVPPVEALEKLEASLKFRCFDKYEVATIKSVQKVPDPIIFGRVDGCGDRFFVAQWDDDIKFEDLVKAGE